MATGGALLSRGQTMCGSSRFAATEDGFYDEVPRILGSRALKYDLEREEEEWRDEVRRAARRFAEVSVALLCVESS
ncbi:unnamed protein product [Lota lota]